LVANFIKLCNVTVSPNPIAGGSATVTGSGTFDQGAEVTVSATANTGYRFVNWIENGMVVPILGKSGLLNTLIHSDGVIHLPSNKEGLVKGEKIEVRLW
jgi:molybdopterin biosynthesis enzyme